VNAEQSDHNSAGLRKPYGPSCRRHQEDARAFPETSLSRRKAELAGAMLLERVQLTDRNLVALNRVFLHQECAHVFHKGARDSGR
jgi:hypothetical protein